MVTVDKAADTVSVFAPFSMHVVLNHNIYIKKFDFQRQMLRGASGLSRIFPLVLLASGGVTMAVRGAGGHSIFLHRKRMGNRARWKLSYFQMCWENNQFCLAL